METLLHASTLLLKSHFLGILIMRNILILKVPEKHWLLLNDTLKFTCHIVKQIKYVDNKILFDPSITASGINLNFILICTIDLKLNYQVEDIDTKSTQK